MVQFEKKSDQSQDIEVVRELVGHSLVLLKKDWPSGGGQGIVDQNGPGLH